MHDYDDDYFLHDENFQLDLFRGQTSSETINTLNGLYEKYRNLENDVNVDNILSTHFAGTARYNEILFLFDNINSFIHILVQNKTLETVLPHYVNLFVQKEYDTFHVIKHLFFVAHQKNEILSYDKKCFVTLDKQNYLDFSVIEDILSKINKQYLIGSSFWESLYHPKIDSKANIEFLTPLSFVKKYQIFSGFKKSTNLVNHLYMAHLFQKKNILSEIIKQNQTIFLWHNSFSKTIAFISLNKMNATNPDFFKQEFIEFYNDCKDETLKHYIKNDMLLKKEHYSESVQKYFDDLLLTLDIHHNYSRLKEVIGDNNKIDKPAKLKI